MEYIRIPNLSRSYDNEWNSNGLLEKAADFIKNWILAQGVQGLSMNFLQEKGRSPTLFVEIQPFNSSSNKNVMMYGHFDKQPHMTGWLDGLSPIHPKIIGDKLYGRGGADDGYAAFTAILSIKAL